MLMLCFYLRSDFGSDKLGLLTNSNWPVDCHELDETTREGSRLANSSSVPHALPPSTTQVRIVRVSLDLTRNFVISREQKNCDISYLKGKNISTHRHYNNYNTMYDYYQTVLWFSGTWLQDKIHIFCCLCCTFQHSTLFYKCLINQILLKWINKVL